MPNGAGSDPGRRTNLLSPYDQRSIHESKPTDETSVRLAVEGIEIRAAHGVFEEERAAGNHFRIDVELAANVTRALQTDRLEDTLDHGAIVGCVQTVSDGRQFNLIESFAFAIVDALLTRFPTVTRATARVRKLAPYTLGSTACTMAEVTTIRT